MGEMNTIFWKIKMVIFSSFLLGCITEYKPSGIIYIDDLLVVEGIITIGETNIQVSRTVGLLDDFSDEIYVNNATVYIECNDGSVSSPGQLEGRGKYIIMVDTLDVNKQYRLHISVDGLEYKSEYLSPLFTPEIESISPFKEGQGEPVYICLDTSDPFNKTNYYRWFYEENWEVWPPLLATREEVISEDGSRVIEHLSTLPFDPNNKYHCWGKNISKNFILASTEKLSENKVKGMKIQEIKPTDHKLSVLYHIRVNQLQLRMEAYDYFYNLQKNVEQGAGIFSGMPTEMNGNIECVSDPDKKVIGYIEVATITTEELYIYYSEGFYEYPSGSDRCYYMVSYQREDKDGNPYLLFDWEISPSGDTAYLFAPNECIDCRMIVNASKERPDFWPNNRY